MPARFSIWTNLRWFSILFLICFSANPKLDAAVYSYELFYGQNVQGQSISSSGFLSMSSNGYTAGVIGVVDPGGAESYKLALYRPDMGFALLQDLDVSTRYLGSMYVNNSGSVCWTEFDFSNGLNHNYFYSNGVVSSLDFGPGYATLAGINNNNEILGLLQTGLSGDPDTEIYNFIYSNNQINYLPTLPNTQLIPASDRMVLSDNGLALFYATPEDSSGLDGNVIHRIGTTDFFPLQKENTLAFFTTSYSAYVTPGGKVFQSFNDFDEDFNHLGGRFVVYNEDGSIKSSIPQPYGGGAWMNDTGDILGSSGGQIIRWDGSQWRPVTNLNLPDSAYLMVGGIDSQGRFFGTAYDVPGDQGFGVAFYASPVPEPASAVVLGSLLVGLGLRTYRTSGASRKIIGT